jgi:hypothetical protein
MVTTHEGFISLFKAILRKISFFLTFEGVAPAISPLLKLLFLSLVFPLWIVRRTSLKNFLPYISYSSKLFCPHEQCAPNKFAPPKLYFSLY